MENMQEKNELPNLWVIHYLPEGEWRAAEDPNGLVFFKGEHPALYIPAERIEKLIEQWRNRNECLEYCRNMEVCAHALESLIGTEKHET